MTMYLDYSWAKVNLEKEHIPPTIRYVLENRQIKYSESEFYLLSQLDKIEKEKKRER